MMSLGNPLAEDSFEEWFLGTPVAIESTFGTAINTAGEVAGYASGLYYSWWAGDAVYYDYPFVSSVTDGTYTRLVDPLYGSSFAYDINDLGQVAGKAGFSAAIWQNGVFTDLDVETGVNLIVANAVNNAGQIVADGWNSQGQLHAFLLYPALILRISDVTVVEGNAGAISAVFSVRLSEPSDEQVTVSYNTADGIATGGSDYQAASGTLTFAPGETRKTVTVLVNGDRLPEPTETFVVNLSNPTNAAIADVHAVGTISDDEPRISITDVTKLEGRGNNKTLFTFTVMLSAAYDELVTMSFQTVNGMATTGNNDYVAKTGTLTFLPGETSKTITIEVKGDNKREVNETFYLDLFGLSSNALFTKNRGVGTILNDD
jgi:hypothetical protein